MTVRSRSDGPRSRVFRGGGRSCSGEPERGGDTHGIGVPVKREGLGAVFRYQKIQGDEVLLVARRRSPARPSPPRIARRSRCWRRATAVDDVHNDLGRRKTPNGVKTGRRVK